MQINVIFLYCTLSFTMLSSCESLDYKLMPDYFTSRRREIVNHRKQYLVGYRPGEIYKSKKTLYHTKEMGIVSIQPHPRGKLLHVIPKGKKFTITSVKADFSISGRLVVPFFEVEGLSGKNHNVIGFCVVESCARNGYHTRFSYNRDLFEICR